MKIPREYKCFERLGTEWTTYWVCDPPEMGETFIVKRDEWNEDQTIRVIYEYELRSMDEGKIQVRMSRQDADTISASLNLAAEMSLVWEDYELAARALLLKEKLRQAILRIEAWHE